MSADDGRPRRPVDGRSARRDRNREAVVTAVLDFLEEGDANPTAQAVANRSGVSLRSVFRYFADLDTMSLAAIDEYLRRNAAVLTFEQPPPGTPLDERIDRYARYRASVEQRIARAHAAAQDRARTSPAIAARLEVARTYVIAQVEQLFAPELAAAPEVTRRTMVAAIHSAALSEVWTNLVERHGLGVEDVVAVFRRLLHGAVAIGRPPA